MPPANLHEGGNYKLLSPTVEAARDIGTDLPDPERNIATG